MVPATCSAIFVFRPALPTFVGERAILVLASTARTWRRTRIVYGAEVAPHFAISAILLLTSLG